MIGIDTAAIKRIISLLKLTWVNWLDRDVARIGASLAYYTLLSLAPLLLLSITTGSLLWGGTEAEQRLLQEIQIIAGSDVAGVVGTMLLQARNSSGGALASVLGFATLLLGASGMFTELRDALNGMWHVPPHGATGLLSVIKERLVAIGIVVVIGFFLLISLLVTATLDMLDRSLTGFWQLPIPLPLLSALNVIISFMGVTVLFALVLRYIPDTRLPWREIGAGALVSAFLFTIGKSLVGLYLGRAALGSLYGASGSTIAIAVWVYYSAQLFLFGAEFTAVYRQSRAPVEKQ